MKRIWRIIKEILLPALAIIGPVMGVIGFWDRLQAWGIVIVLGAALVVSIYLRYRQTPTGRLELLEGDAVLIEATALLKETEKDLCYYGGSGFMGKHEEWKNAYEKKLHDEDIRIMRFLDAKSVGNIRTMLKKNRIAETKINRDTSEYKTWLETHSKNLVARGENNYFFDFKGAPIWKYGIHFIIFDEKHIVIPFLSSMKTRSAIFIRDCPEIARELVKSLEFLKDNFKLQDKNAEQVAALAKDKKAEEIADLAK